MSMMKFEKVALAYSRDELLDANTTFKPNLRAREIDATLDSLIIRDFTRYGFGLNINSLEQNTGLQPGSTPRMNGNR